jgi:hypothetical protein
MSNLDVRKNWIREKEMREIMAIAMSMDSMCILCKVPFKDKTLATLDVSGENLGAEGALVVAEYLRDNRALVSLDVSSNDLGEADLLPTGWQLQKNTRWKYELKDGRRIKGGLSDSFRGQNTPPPGSKLSGAIALANALKDNGTIMTVTMCKFPLPIQDIKTKAELELSGKLLVGEDAIVIAALLPLNVSGTMSVDILIIANIKTIPALTRGR